VGEGEKCSEVIVVNTRNRVGIFINGKIIFGDESL
jgi:hypothetical protein